MNKRAQQVHGRRQELVIGIEEQDLPGRLDEEVDEGLVGINVRFG